MGGKLEGGAAYPYSAGTVIVMDGDMMYVLINLGEKGVYR